MRTGPGFRQGRSTPRLVREIRELRKRVDQLDQEGAELDSILEELRQIADRIHQL